LIDKSFILVFNLLSDKAPNPITSSNVVNCPVVVKFIIILPFAYQLYNPLDGTENHIEDDAIPIEYGYSVSVPGYNIILSPVALLSIMVGVPVIVLSIY
jgi:hypothetical protein